MPGFPTRKIINHRFHVDNYKGDLGIGYDMIIELNLLVQLGPASNFKRQVLQWNCATVHMKRPIGLLGKYYLNKRKMYEMVMQTAEPYSTREATEILMKILDCTYAKKVFKQVDNNETHLKYEERTRLLRFLKDFKDLFDDNLGY